MRQPIPIVDGAYDDQSRPFDAQLCINYIPEKAESEGARSQARLLGVPGMDLLATVGDGPHRGSHNVEGRLFVVSGTTLYEVKADLTTTTIGTIPGSQLVFMDHNQIAGGNELFIGNTVKGYTFNTVNSVFGEITDPGFGMGAGAAFIDGYMASVDPSGTFWGHSELDDATSYNTLDRYDSEASPDKIVGIINNHREMWVFNQRTTQPYYNAGSTTGTFQVANGTVIEEGAASRYCQQVIDNSVIWLSNNGIIHRASGYIPQRISTHAIEEVLSELKSKWASAFSFTWTDRGHQVYYLTIDKYTFGYDCATGKWHTRQSYQRGRWRLNTLTYWNNRWVGGDYVSGKLYALNWNRFDDDGEPLIARRVTGVLAQNQDRVLCHRIELLMDTGHGSIPPGCSVRLRYSDDGGRSYSNFRDISLGTIGEYSKRVQATRLGQFRTRVWDIQVSSPVRRDIMGAVAILGGTNG